MTQPHDALFKLTFSEPAELAAMLRDLLPPPVLALLDLDGLVAFPPEQHSAELRARTPDLHFQAPWRPGGYAHLTILIEHQSSPDPQMPYRALRAAMRVWEQVEGPRLPVVLTLVVAHGERPWTAPRRLSELYDAPPEAIAGLKPYLPELELWFEDLSVTPDDQLPGQGGGRLALLLMRHAHEGRTLPLLNQHLALYERALRERGDHWAAAVLKYAIYLNQSRVSPAETERAMALLHPPEREQVMSWMQREREEGRQEGRQEGHEEARPLVQQDLIRRGLRRRFGAIRAEHERAILVASPRRLDQWVDMIFTVPTADALFDAPQDDEPES